MTRPFRNFIAGLLFISLLLFSNSYVIAADGGILLEHKFKSGESVDYTLSVESNSLFTLYGLEKKITQQAITNFKMTEDPTTTVKSTLAFIIDIIDEKIISDGEKVESSAKGTKFKLKLSKNGKIVATEAPTKIQNFQDLILSFPEKPLKAGDDWTMETPFKIQSADSTEMDLKAVLNCKVIEFKKFEGKECAVIETKLNIADEKTKTANLKAEASGRMYFDYENGKIVAVNNTVDLDIKVLDEGAQKKSTVPVSTLKTKMQIKLLSKY